MPGVIPDFLAIVSRQCTFEVGRPMNDSTSRARLETEAIVLGYAMSRLDVAYLKYRKVKTWRAVFAEAGHALSVPPSSIKNLRDEFDPLNDNNRQGWHQRPLRPNRLRVLEDLKDTSDDALMALVDRIIARDEETTAEAVDSMAVVPRTAHNVAERLLTGRRARRILSRPQRVNRCGRGWGTDRPPSECLWIRLRSSAPAKHQD